jgi:hypothetical protein
VVRFLGGDGALGTVTPTTSVELLHRGFQRHGAFAGTWCPYGPEADLPPDQREEDALCLTFETEPLAERLEVLGHPRLRLRIAADRPLAFVVARLCDVSRDGTSTLLSRGALNLAHRDGHDVPTPLEPGQAVDVEVELDALGQAVAAGNRLRLAISSTYWPWLWPSPEPVELTIVAGPASWLELPVRPLGTDDGPPPSFGGPRTAPSLAVEDEVTVPAFHRLQRDLVTGEVVMELNQDGDKRMTLPDGLTLIEDNRDRFEIVEGDPLSASVTSVRRLRLERGSWRIDVRTTSSMTSDAERFRLFDRLEAREGDDLVFERTWERDVPRDHV